jgi:hypothetical protein
MDALVKRCEHCNETVSESKRGRPQRFCSDRCRQAHRKIGSIAENGLRYRTGRAKPKMVSEILVLIDEIRPENLSQKINLCFERVNEATFKLTDGESTNVPASHGQWAGYRTTKAIGWVTCVVPGMWLARYGDMVCGPLTLPKAKAAAMAMARGSAGDYHVQNPIAHLNGLAARLIDLDADPLPDVGGGNE